MRKPDKHTRGGRGYAAVTLVAMLIALLGMGAFAVDVGLLYFKRGQLQKAADLGALAGANAMISHGEDLDTVRAVAVSIARANLRPSDTPAAAVTGADVTFPTPEEIEVKVFRSGNHGNPVQMVLAPALGIFNRNVTATARARVMSACSSACLLPVTIPAKFTWDDECALTTEDKDKYALNGQMDVDCACEMASVEIANEGKGYTDADMGTLLTIKYGSADDAAAPSFYNPIDFPPLNKDPHPITGADAYNQNILGCTGSNSVVVEVGDELQMEPGGMTGPTASGFLAAIAEDPGAFWDPGSGSIQGSAFEVSPRVRTIALYDPTRPPVSGRNTLFVFQLGAIFIEAVTPDGDVTARFVHTVAKSPVTSGGECLLKMAVMVRDSSR
jgi:hypothetical protein